MKKISCILLVDDNPADNAFHSIKIKAAGVCDTIKVATTGDAALDYLNNHSPVPELIFLDINLPGMDGFEFLREYQRLPENLRSGLVIIMLTTSLNPDDQKRAGSYKEVNDFIIKPLTTEKVKEVVMKHFNE